MSGRWRGCATEIYALIYLRVGDGVSPGVGGDRIPDLIKPGRVLPASYYVVNIGVRSTRFVTF